MTEPTVERDVTSQDTGSEAELIPQATAIVIRPICFHDEPVINPRRRDRRPKKVVTIWELRARRYWQECNVVRTSAPAPSRETDMNYLANIARGFFGWPEFANVLMHQAIEDIERKVSQCRRGIAVVSREKGGRDG